MTTGTASEQERLRAGDFARESKGQAGPIGTQRVENAEHADDRAWDLLLRTTDKVSASRFATKARAGWPEVWDWVTNRRIDVLILWEISRGDRVSDTWVPFISACRDHDVLIYVTNESTLYDPREAAHRKRLIDAGSDAEMESEKISKRARKGIRGAAAEGKGHGPASYGYTRVYNQNDRKIWVDEINPETASHVVFIVTSIAKGRTVGWIQRELFARGAHPPTIQRKLDKGETLTPEEKAERWSRSGIPRLAMKVAYLGMRSHRSVEQRRRGEPGNVHQATWPPISDAEDWADTFYRAQEVLSKPTRKRSASGKTRHLLSYIATVSGCERRGIMSMQTRRNGREVRYRCLDDSCLSISGPDLEEYVVQMLMARLSDPAVRVVFSKDGALAAAQAEVTRLGLELVKIQSLWANDKISDAALIAKEGILLPQLKAARVRVADSTSASAVLTLLGEGEFTAEHGRPRWDAMSVAARREVINIVFDTIEVGPAKGITPRSATPAERLRLVKARTTITWRHGLELEEAA